MKEWNYNMDECPLYTKVKLLSANDGPVLPQQEFIGTIVITTNRPISGTYRSRGKCYEGIADYFYRNAIIAWKELD